jgi:hypothetical protein
VLRLKVVFQEDLIPELLNFFHFPRTHSFFAYVTMAVLRRHGKAHIPCQKREHSFTFDNKAFRLIVDFHFISMVMCVCMWENCWRQTRKRQQQSWSIAPTCIGIEREKENGIFDIMWDYTRAIRQANKYKEHARSYVSMCLNEPHTGAVTSTILNRRCQSVTVTTLYAKKSLFKNSVRASERKNALKNKQTAVMCVMCRSS